VEGPRPSALAAAATFSVVDGVILRPLPYRVDQEWREVVGVVRDTKYRRVREAEERLRAATCELRPATCDFTASGRQEPPEAARSQVAARRSQA